MRISSTNYSYTSKKTMFRSKSCEYRLSENMVMGLYTWMFREDIDWLKLAQFELENFKQKDNVNIIQFASSDGSEGYTQILSLLHTNSKATEKFFPIQAYDVNSNVIAEASSGYIKLNSDDMYQLALKDINVKKYFKETTIQAPLGVVYKTTDELSKRIRFNTGDMFEILPSIKDESNTILMARNCLGYYAKATVRNFIKDASKVLKNGSLFIVGQLENSSYFDAIFNQNKFFPVMKNVYKKGV